MRSLVRLAFVLAAAAAGCQPGSDQAATTEAPVVKLAPEDVFVVRRGDIDTGPRISGTLEAAIRAEVRAETAGAVVAIGPELGERVKKGDLLARIEAKALGDVTTSAQSALQAAQAQYELAQREVQRTEALVKGGALAQRELDRARSELTAAAAQVNQARAQLASSRQQLGDATVRSPITGVVARRAVSLGDVVSPGSDLYEVIDPTTMRLDASVSSEDLSAIAPGKLVAFSVRGYPGQKFTGTITRVAPAADPVTRQIQLLVDIPNPSGKLVAGLYAEGRVTVATREGLIVPLDALDLTGDQPTVLRVRRGVVERANVALGVRDERAEIVEITGGLEPGDVLVLSRATKNVGPGTRVVLPRGVGTPATAATPAASDAGTTVAAPAAGSGRGVRPAGSATVPPAAKQAEPR